MKKQFYWHFLLAFCIISYIFYCLYAQVFWSFPRGVHCWAQSDRLSVALNFCKRGFNLFYPSTLNNTTADSIGMELPLQAFLAAGLAKIFGLNYISVFYRGISLSICFVGIFYLFQWVHQKTLSFYAALSVCLFLVASPVFSYYAGNYLADAPAFSLMLIASYYTFLFVDNKVISDAYKGLAIAFVAALMKMSLAFYLVGLGLVQLSAIQYRATHLNYTTLKFNIFLSKKILFYLAFGLMGVLALLLQYFHINQLNTACPNCFFLSNPVPLPWEMDKILSHTQEVLNYHYYTFLASPAHWLYFELALGTVLIGFFSKKIRKNLAHYYFMWFWSLLCLLILYKLFGKQFVVHNYYFIASGLPFLVLTVLLATLILNRYFSSTSTIIISILSPLLTLFVLFNFNNSLTRGLKKVNAHSYAPEFSEAEVYGWLYDATIDWTTLAVPAQAKVVCFNNKPTANLDLTYFNRLGMITTIRLEKEGREKIIDCNKLGFEYFIFSKAQQEEALQKQPDMFTTLELVQQGNTFAIYHYKPAKTSTCSNNDVLPHLF